jgi:ABC-type transport system substrate-binding protein
VTDHRARRRVTLTRRHFLWRAAGGVAALTRWFQGWPRLMAAQAQKHEPRGQMIWAIHVTMAPTRFDPPKTPGVITPFMFLYTLHDALVKPIPGNPMFPSLATRGVENPDELMYAFELSHRVTFHNGDPSTAEDV